MYYNERKTNQPTSETANSTSSPTWIWWAYHKKHTVTNLFLLVYYMYEHIVQKVTNYQKFGRTMHGDWLIFLALLAGHAVKNFKGSITVYNCDTLYKFLQHPEVHCSERTSWHLDHSILWTRSLPSVIPQHPKGTKMDQTSAIASIQLLHAFGAIKQFMHSPLTTQINIHVVYQVQITFRYMYFNIDLCWSNRVHLMKTTAVCSCNMAIIIHYTYILSDYSGTPPYSQATFLSKKSLEI